MSVMGQRVSGSMISWFRVLVTVLRVYIYRYPISFVNHCWPSFIFTLAETTRLFEQKRAIHQEVRLVIYHLSPCLFLFVKFFSCDQRVGSNPRFATGQQFLAILFCCVPFVRGFFFLFFKIRILMFENHDQLLLLCTSYPTKNSQKKCKENKWARQKIRATKKYKEKKQARQTYTC